MNAGSQKRRIVSFPCLLSLIFLALLFLLLNCIRPLTIDDTAYYRYAEQIAQHPFDPYGFEIFWYEQPMPAHQVLAPPLLPYWMSVPIKVFGHNAFIVKLWLLPFSLLFVFSLHALVRRFVRGHHLLLVWMTTLSPVFLPSFNLMLDVPVTALGMAALAIFFRAGDRDHFGLAMSAGVLAGLAIQTKYTGLLTPVVMLTCGLVHGRWRHALLAASISALMFIGWEWLMFQTYGDSHFLYHLRAPFGAVKKYTLIMPLVTLLGGVAPVQFLIALFALRARRHFVWTGAGLVIIGFLLVACLDDGIAQSLRSETAAFGLLGLLVLSTLFLVMKVACTRKTSIGFRPRSRNALFLILWLILEMAGYFAFTPFPAVRRIMGVYLLLALGLGRLASVSCRSLPQQLALRWLATASILLGMAYYAVDILDARAQMVAVSRALSVSLNSDPGRIWYVGHFGFQYYAEREGMIPVVPGQSLLRRGEYLVVPHKRIIQQRLQFPADDLKLMETIAIDDPIPLRTVTAYYGTRLPIEHRKDSRLDVSVYRVVNDFVARPMRP